MGCKRHLERLCGTISQFLFPPLRKMGRIRGCSCSYYESPCSAEGEKIAFVSLSIGNGNSEIYVMNADGTGQKRLTNSVAGIKLPCKKY